MKETILFHPFKKLKMMAEEYLKAPVSEAVITVPAYFSNAQRQATKKAGEIAGLEIKRIINEPTAAALAFGYKKNKIEKNIVVYDLGGGSFDVSILKFGNGVYEVKATSGNTHLGGDDFDRRIMEWFISEFKNDTGIDLGQNHIALQRLRDSAEKAKIELSAMQTTEINLPFIVADNSDHKHLKISLTRENFEKLISEHLKQTREIVIKTLVDANLSASQIDEVILIGDSIRYIIINYYNFAKY